jgi:predicted dehydrogenase
MNFGIGCHSLDQALRLFGRPKSVTAFYRTLRGVESEAEDSFTMTFQYADSPLLVHVKTHVASTMRYPLKYFVRGYDGTFIKHGTDQQEDQTNAGLTPASPGFGVEPEDMYGELTTKTQVLDSQVQVGNLWSGKVKSHVGDYGRYYADVVKALRGTGPLVVDPAMSADGIRIIELARESAYKGVTLPF